MKSKYVLGIHLGHDSSASLLCDGEIVGCVEEERFVRVKQFAGFPYNGIKFLLNKAEITPGQVDAVAVAGEKLHIDMPYAQLHKRIGKPGLFGELYYKSLLIMAFLFDSNIVRYRIFNEKRFWFAFNQEISRLGFKHSCLTRHDHHSCHAASAYYASPFNSALVVTQDGKGDFCSGSVFQGAGNRLHNIARNSHLDSIGQIYSAVTRFLGYKPNRHEGKITGLAAYADAMPLLEQFGSLLTSENGRLRRVDWLRDPKGLPAITGIKRRILVMANTAENLPYEISFELLYEWLDNICKGFKPEQIASAVQTATEEWVVQQIKTYNQATNGSKNVCLAGGVFANVKINQRIRDQIPWVKNVYIQPAMGDSGLSLGAALLRWHKDMPDAKISSSMKHVYYGPSFNDEEIENALDLWQGKIIYRYSDEIEDEIGALIHEGKVVGRFNGPLEWGPRALGNRSILIRPTDKSINDSMNKRLKRTEFMPFAPSVLDYRAKDYFIGYENNQIAADFMTITYDVYPEKIKEIEAVVHVDGTARPQIVKEDINQSYYKILKAYEKRSEIGAIVNTSFNMHEEPIVCTPGDALRALGQGAVDVLAIGHFLVTMNSI